jgi:ubiquinol oxidase
LLFVVCLSWSYRLNADFEDHAEHEYMAMVAEHLDWDCVPFETSFADDFGQFDLLANVFRQIGHGEWAQKRESEALMKKPPVSLTIPPVVPIRHRASQ